jgi:ribosomal protein S18 acetylase RimI-like enzyme
MELHLIDQYVFCAEKTGVFSSEEITTLREILSDETNHYLILSKKDKGKLAGFIILGRTPFTAFGWDIYWVVVSPDFQRQGIGRALMALAEEEMFKRTPEHAVIRVETSSRPEYTSAHKLYMSCGYKKIGEIPNFYKQNDALFFFSKEIFSALKENT